MACIQFRERTKGRVEGTGNHMSNLSFEQTECLENHEAHESLKTSSMKKCTRA